jgi:DNA invertase Pin-like site-specific DNA recombinase
MSDTPNTPQQLLEILKTVYPTQDSRDVDITTLRYVIYARKSTQGEERQERSIKDQIDDCLKREVVANQLNIVGKPIEERCSAKEPDIRPKFRAMLDDIKAGKVDGIVTWHTDRLARNMKEAGEIIDLLDKGILKDLRFATSTFENSPTGKMLLGISFVLSKQYSEHLSESVSRGNKKKIEDGIFFDEMKHGYLISSDGKLFPDGNNFVLIKQAFEMRLEGQSQLDIAKWLNSQGYMIRKKGKNPQTYHWDKDSVSKLLKDSVYAGVLRYGKNFAVLSDWYDFTPAVSVEDYLKINKVKDFGDPKLVSSLMVKPRESTKADLLRGMVYCAYCGKTYSSSITTKRHPETRAITEARYYYRCETDGCEFKNKSIRAKVLIDYVVEFLSTHIFTTESNYEHYVAEAKEYAANQAKELDGTVATLNKQVGNKEKEYERSKNTIRDNPQLAPHYDLDGIKAELDTLQADQRKAVETRKELKQAILTYKEYLELFSSVGVNLAKTHDISLMDATVRKFFLNFTIRDNGRGEKQRYEITHRLKDPWAEFIRTQNFDCGRLLTAVREDSRI